MKSRALFCAPLLVALALHAWASGAYGQDFFVVALALAAIPLGGRVPLGNAAMRFLGGLFLVAGAAIGWSHVPQLGSGPGALPRTASLIAVGSLLCAVSRLYVREDWRRERATFVLGTVAVAAAGSTRLGLGYVGFSAVYLVVALVALRARDPARARFSELAARHRAGLAGAVVLAGAFTLGFARLVPPLNAVVEKAIERRFVLHDMVGFGAGASLDAMREMIQSNVEVLRVALPRRGVPVDYLRGAVFDEYSSEGFWQESPGRVHVTPVESELAPPDAAVRVRRVTGTPSRYFLPLDVHDVRVVTGRIVVDELGSTFTVGDDRVTEYTFVPGRREKLTVATPRATDQWIARSERSALARLAHEWTDGAVTDEGKLDAIVTNLGHGYRYSLTSAGASAEPLLDFLFGNKVGYCIHFATAMTLLARSSGIPARLVTGYRVAEWSPVAREYVVREKNAHAWVEAWVNGEWRTYDPTPLQELPQDREHVASFGTLVSDSVVRVERAVAYGIAHVTPVQLLSLLAGLGIMWVSVRWLRGRVTSAAVGRGEVAVDLPLPCFALLARSLERKGLLRDRAEPLELFAARLDALGMGEAGRLVGRYAALRYGGLGDRDGLERDVERFVRGISA